MRKAGPRGGSYTLAELIDKYDPIVSKKASAVKLSPEKTAAYKKEGYELTKQGRVIVPHSAVEKVKVTHGDFYTEDLHGIRRIPKLVKFENLEQYLTDVKANRKELQKLKSRNSKFAFRFYGGHSRVYDSIDLMIDELREYQTVSEAINKRDSRAMNEIYRHLELVEVNKRAWEKSKDLARAKAKAAHKRKRGERKRTLEKLKQGPAWKLQQYHQQRAEQQRRYRASLKGAKKEAYQKAARARAKKSERNRKGK